MVEFSYIVSATGGSMVTVRVMVTLSGAALRGRTTETVSSEPGLPSSMTSIMARERSRVSTPEIASRMSPSVKFALSAGLPGTTETTVA
jgi:hypothetical protein